MRILVLGSGAREHAIVKALLRENADRETPHHIIAAPGNAGIAAEVETVALNANDPELVADFAVDNDIELVVIGPEAPLVAGVADAVRPRGIAVFGPGKAAAAIEGSKAFAKRIMESAGVPTGAAVHAANLEEAERALDELGAPYVIKADGLAAGKGVIVTSDREAAVSHAAFWLQHGGILIEEFLAGREVSLFFITDGTNVLPLTPAQDFKRALDGDQGPNTGGMGAYTPLPWLPEGFVAEVTERVALPTVRQLAQEQTPFIGLLYCGLIVTDRGTKVIEFNARFGDPETQAVLARLRSPLSDLLYGAATGTLGGMPAPEFSDDVALTVVLASEGYPESPVTGRVIGGLDRVTDVALDHAATARNAQGDFVATGGRVLSVVATAPDFAAARAKAYAALDMLELEGGHYRRDIAAGID